MKPWSFTLIHVCMHEAYIHDAWSLTLMHCACILWPPGCVHDSNMCDAHIHDPDPWPWWMYVWSWFLILMHQFIYDACIFWPPGCIPDANMDDEHIHDHGPWPWYNHLCKCANMYLWCCKFRHQPTNEQGYSRSRIKIIHIFTFFLSGRNPPPAPAK